MPDDPHACLVIVRADGKKSAPYRVSLRARRDVVRLRSDSPAISTVRLSDEANYINVVTGTRSTVSGVHLTAFQSEDDTDVYRVQLKNGWTYHHVEWVLQEGADGRPFGQDPEPVDASDFTLSIPWFADFFAGSAEYALNVYVTGPTGVPYE
ncbi:hypothetical protein [Ideonella sp. A 288]|uniref:hypothetical protein n=1 Tax=Ideonella sp. A 288 TaxID=1962181 RepID=UPI000B4AEC39|nr:hypothetical protein [Ideonella sp. A 288]